MKNKNKQTKEKRKTKNKPKKNENTISKVKSIPFSLNFLPKLQRNFQDDEFRLRLF